MPVLHMNTEAVRAMGRQLGISADSLCQQAQQLTGRIQTLATSWDSTSADLFDTAMQGFLRQLTQTGEQATSLSQRLEQEVVQWEQAAAQLGGGTGVLPEQPITPMPVPPSGEDKPDISPKPSSPGGGSPPATPPPSPKPPVDIPDYDGKTPAEGTVVLNQAHLVNPPLTSTSSNRDSRLYGEVLDQFAVAHNPRYMRTPDKTYCNIFVWDATRAMGAEIPHWVDNNGNSVPVASPEGRELNANSTVQWLENHGQSNGWRAVTAEEAQAMANQGKPTVATWKNPNPAEAGHVAMVRPGEYDSGLGPNIAQAGGNNFNEGHVIKDGFKNRPVVYYVHD